MMIICRQSSFLLGPDGFCSADWPLGLSCLQVTLNNEISRSLPIFYLLVSLHWTSNQPPELLVTTFIQNHRRRGPKAQQLDHMLLLQMTKFQSSIGI